MGRGGRLDAHERHFYLISRLACEVADSRRDFQARAQSTRGESLALRRVVPSPKKRRHTQIRPLKRKFAERRHLDAERESTPFSARRVLGRT